MYCNHSFRELVRFSQESGEGSISLRYAGGKLFQFFNMTSEKSWVCQAKVSLKSVKEVFTRVFYAHIETYLWYLEVLLRSYFDNKHAWMRIRKPTQQPIAYPFLIHRSFKWSIWWKKILNVHNALCSLTRYIGLYERFCRKKHSHNHEAFPR